MPSMLPPPREALGFSPWGPHATGKALCEGPNIFPSMLSQITGKEIIPLAGRTLQLHVLFSHSLQVFEIYDARNLSWLFSARRARQHSPALFCFSHPALCPRAEQQFIYCAHSTPGPPCPVSPNCTSFCRLIFGLGEINEGDQGERGAKFILPTQTSVS